MTDYPLVSIIVPVYNVEQYVRECVESLVSQKYPNLEIVLVDDGSTDSSGIICDELAAVHEGVTCLHKENGGPSDARNYGLACSHGELISFVDSDDYVSPVFILALYEAAKKYKCPIAAVPGGKDFRDGDPCALVEKICPVTSEVPRGDRASKVDEIYPVATTLLGAHEFLRMMLYQEVTTGPQWRLYRREVLGRDPFPKGLYYEDLASTYKFIHHAGRVALVGCRELYAYRLRSTSIIRQAYRHVKATSALVVSAQLYRDIAEWYPDLRVAGASRCFSVCRMVFAQVPARKDTTEEMERDREALWGVIRRHRKTVFFDRHARRRERLSAAISFLGIGPFTFFCRACRMTGLMQ